MTTQPSQSHELLAAVIAVGIKSLLTDVIAPASTDDVKRESDEERIRSIQGSLSLLHQDIHAHLSTQEIRAVKLTWLQAIQDIQQGLMEL